MRRTPRGVGRCTGPATTVLEGMSLGLESAVWALIAVAVAIGGVVAPDGHRVRTIVAATVQGGGEQQTRSTGNESGLVLDRHMNTAATVKTPVDLVLLPENIVNINGEYRGSYEEQRLTNVATSLGATVVAGVVEDRGSREHFWNFAVAISPDGGLEGRYDKVRRVPYGEYVPMRFLLDPLAKDILPPRDDVEGTGPAVLDTNLGRLGVVISWETFFPRRVREALHHDAQIVLNPTNGPPVESIAGDFEHGAGRFRFDAAATRKQLAAFQHTGFWQPMDTLRDKIHLEELWAGGQAPWKVWK